MRPLRRAGAPGRTAVGGLLSLLLTLALAAAEPPVAPPPPAAADAPAPQPQTPPPFPAEGVQALLAGLESMMVTGTHRKIDELMWDGLPSETRDRWREAMKHEFRQIAYKPYQTSIYDWRYIPPDAPRESPAIPANLPPAKRLWAVRVDIDYRYAARSRQTAGETPAGEDRDEQATVLFYLLETDAGVRIVGSDRNFFMQFGQALPRGLIGAWAVGLITGFLALVFWVTMASHCWAARPKLRAWRWITAAAPILGAGAYFFWVYWRHPRRPLISLSLIDSWRQTLIGATEVTIVVPPTAPSAAPGPAPAPPPTAPAAAPASASPPAAATPAQPPVNGPGRAPRA